MDPRIQQYAKLLVERSIDVQPGWQVLVRSSVLARPVVEEIVRLIARRDAYALVRLSFTGVGESVWQAEAPLERLGTLAPLWVTEADTVDARITIWAPENTREESNLDEERRRILNKTWEPLFKRVMANELPWVIGNYPVPSLAQDAGMSLGEYEDFFYGACLLDWDAFSAELDRVKERFDRADEIRVVADGTDVTLSISGREALADDGHINMPGGEIFFGPVENATNGVIEFSEFPAVYSGHEVAGARLVFEDGRVVDASAETGEEFLIQTLDTDEGARVLGELGIGCNPGITRYMKDVGFDEKIAGTVHFALGGSYPQTGGTNESAIHWDLVKDLRAGGKIFLDGELVQEDGQWRF
ncbi:MAG: aminopeptidase [Gaiellaceae bacterium]|jgi:aminopeptidase|nr:aminopeptidase [Gaiellaceae bacterium]